MVEFGGSEVFKKAWRSAVDRVRARGATNILWVFHVNSFPAINDDWNLMAAFRSRQEIKVAGWRRNFGLWQGATKEHSQSLCD